MLPQTQGVSRPPLGGRGGVGVGEGLFWRGAQTIRYSASWGIHHVHSMQIPPGTLISYMALGLKSYLDLCMQTAKISNDYVLGVQIRGRRKEDN